MTATIQRTRRHHDHPVRSSPRRARPDRRPPAVLAVGALALLGLGVHGVLSGPGDVPASAAGTGPAPVVRSVKVHAGDTLWSIAETHHGDVAIQRYVDALVRLNGDSTAIETGQLVRLP